MGIKNKYYIPEAYISKIPFCDNCGIELYNTNRELLSDPPQLVYKCSNCNTEYRFYSTDLQGRWKWREI